MRKIGIVLNDLGPNQLSYTTICEINNIVKSCPDVSPCVFTESLCEPCVPIHFPCYSIAETFSFDGVLVCPSIDLLVKTIKATRAQKVYYVSDIDINRQHFKYNREDYIRIVNDKNIIKISRSSLYMQVFKQLGSEITIPVMPDIDIAKILELVNER